MNKDSKISGIQEKVNSEKQKLSTRITPSSKSKKVSKAVEKNLERYAMLLEMEGEIKEAMDLLAKSLEEQRRYADSLADIQPINSPNKFRGKLSRRLYYLQEILCLSKDYKEFRDKDISIEDENKLMNSIVIHAEFISDELLIALGLEDAEFLKLEYPEQLKRKIQHISAVKEFFANTRPLQVGSGINDYTGRIMMTKKVQNPAYGKIILIQSVESGDESSKKQRKTLTFHDDIYSFLRSQKHTRVSLNGKEKRLSKILINLRKLRFQIGNKSFLESIAKQVEPLSAYQSYQLKLATSHLKKINGIDAKSDSENLEISITRIDSKLREIISQKTSVYKHSENITEITRNLEEDWKNFYKNFKSVLKKFNNDKIDYIVDSFSGMHPDFKKTFSERIESILHDNSNILSIIDKIDFDEAAKEQAYFWALEDSNQGKDTSSKKYQEHQYFEALKQKREYFEELKTTKSKEKNFMENSGALFDELEVNGSLRKLISDIDTYLKSKPEFCVNPFAKIYERVWMEFYKINTFRSKKDIIGIIKSILTINLLLKEQGFLIFISKLEGSLDVKRLEKSNEAREFISRRINKNLSNMAKKDFLKKFIFPKDSAVNKRFEEHIKALINLKTLLASGEFSEIERLLTELRKGFYNK